LHEHAAHAFPVCLQFIQERARHCQVVKLAQCVLQRAKLREERLDRTCRETISEEIAAVAKALERDAHTMTLTAVTPVDVCSPLA